MSETDTKRHFRALVVLSMALFVTWTALPRVEGRLYAAHLYDILVLDGFGAQWVLGSWAWWTLAALFCAATIGMYSFRSYSRWLFLALTLVGFVLHLFGGISVQTAVGSLIGTLVSLTDGALLYLAFLSPLRAEFAATEREPPSE